MSNISHVAARAGVSIKTVSRVLNNEQYVRPATGDRIRAAISELNYIPNIAARQLASRRSFLFVLLVNNIHSTSYEHFLLATVSECRRFGYHLIVEYYDTAANHDDIVFNLKVNLKPDGIMLSATHSLDSLIIDSIRRSGIPLVCMADVSDSYGVSVQESERAASEALVGHLISLGHRQIAMIAPSDRRGSANNRLQGYIDAMRNSGLGVETELIKRGDFSFAAGVRIASCFLRKGIRPSAIFAANDSMALGALAAARQMGIRVPEGLAVAGFDDSPEATMSFPRLTSVRPPLAVIARAAVAALLGNRNDTTDMRHRLILRRSTSC